MRIPRKVAARSSSSNMSAMPIHGLRRSVEPNTWRLFTIRKRPQRNRPKPVSISSNIRMCRAHEWEGACAGELEEPDYRFDLAQGVAPNVAVERMRSAHNRLYEPTKTWSYGPEYQRGICATGSFKTAGCPG